MLSVAAFLGSAVPSAVEVCPGEGARYGDFKCNHDGTHRVCAQLIDNTSHAPLKYSQASQTQVPTATAAN